jgi:hypothetical protein
MFFLSILLLNAHLFSMDCEKSNLLARSDPLFSNIGRLQVDSGKYGITGSVIYLRGLYCITAAHCVDEKHINSDTKFTVTFELDNGRVEQRDIESFFI